MSDGMLLLKAKAATARLLIEQVEALGAPSQDPLTLFSVLNSLRAASDLAFNGDAMRTATVALLIGYRLMGISLLLTGDIAQGRAHLDQAIRLYPSCAQCCSGSALGLGWGEGHP